MKSDVGFDFDVIVVGAGPVGFLTAIELALGGVSVLILERLNAPNLVSKALMIGALGIEALERRGMKPQIAEAEARAFAAINSFSESNGQDSPFRGTKFSGHFAGLTLIRKDAQKEPERRGRLVDQAAAEAMLAERARLLGIEVRRGCDVVGLSQDSCGVDVEWTSASDRGQIKCAYLVGCDGGRSSVRKMAGFNFPGTAPTMTMYTAVAELDHPERLLPLGWNCTAGGVFSFGPFPGRIFMLDFSGPPEDRQAPVTREEIEAVLRRISGKDVRVKCLESSGRWTDNTRLVDTYRLGRVLLAGDAAHIHSPFGGQGMSLGLVDAANLGWKLASVIRGEMPEPFLDSYMGERRPIAEAVLANTLAQTAIMRPDPQSAAMREIVANLMQFDNVNRLFGEMISGLSVRYDLGSEHDLVGRLIGDRAIRNGETASLLYEHMYDAAWVLLDSSSDKKASKLVAAIDPKIRCITVDTGPSMLIRPDACVAWVGEENGTDGLEVALKRWFGLEGGGRSAPPGYTRLLTVK